MRWTLKTWHLFLFGISSLLTWTYAHEADPSGLLARYSLYGKVAVVSAPSVTTEPTGRGWVGSDGNFSGSGSTTIYGPLKVAGDFIPQGGTYLGGVEVMGTISGSGGTATFGDPANGPDTVRYNSTIPNTVNGNPVLLPGEAAVGIPEFPTYSVQPDASRNCTLNSGGWTGTGCPIAGQSATTALPPGRYGDVVIQPGVKGRVLGGDYEFASLFINDTLLVDKQYAQTTRLMVKGNFTLKSTNTGALVTKLNRDFGRVLVYVEGTSVETQQGQTLMATLVAKNATVALNPNFSIYGQVMAKQINLSNGFNGAAGQFVSYIRVGIFIPGSDALSFYENTDDPNENFSNNSRRIQIPVELTEPTNVEVRLNFYIESSQRVPAAQIGSPGDFDTSRTRMASLYSSGQLTILPGNTRPTRLPSFWLVDDLEEEALEYMTIRLNGVSPILAASLLGADATGTARYDFPIVSDDGSTGDPGAGVDPDTTVQVTPGQGNTSSSSTEISSSSEGPNSSSGTSSSDSNPQSSSSSSVPKVIEGTLTDSTLIIGNDTLHLFDSLFMSQGDTVFTNAGELVLINPDGTETRIPLDYGGNSIEHTYENSEGSIEVIRIPLVYDTIPPVVIIVNPESGLGFQNPAVTVEWTVDGVTQDTLTSEMLTQEEHWIVREAFDRAGNRGVDSVKVRFVPPELKVTMQIVSDLVSSGSRVEPLMDAVFEQRQREPIPSELFSVSWVSSDGSRLQEAVYGGPDQVDTAEGGPWIQVREQRFPGIEQRLTLTLPSGTCLDGSAMWNLEINQIVMEAYDLQGQFIRRIAVPGFKLSAEDLAGVLRTENQATLMFQLADGNEILTASNGRKIGSGVVILRTRLRSTLDPTDCNPLKAVRNEKQSLAKIGLRRM